MTLRVSYTAPGRGAWSPKGGTLNLQGTGPGMNYRSTAGSLPVIGERVYNQFHSTTTHDVHIDLVAVWRAAMALQKALNAQKVATPLVVDGMWGPKTDAVARAYQQRERLIVDGVVGPQTAKALFMPMLAARANHIPFLVDLCAATVALESGFDPGAVGVTTPRDLGISQINTQAHPDITYMQAFDPDLAFDKKLSIIYGNFAFFKDRKPADRIVLAIVAYNGGAGGAMSWDNAGRPYFGSDGKLHWATRYLRAISQTATDPTLVAAIHPYL